MYASIQQLNWRRHACMHTGRFSIAASETRSYVAMHAVLIIMSLLSYAKSIRGYIAAQKYTKIAIAMFSCAACMPCVAARFFQLSSDHAAGYDCQWSYRHAESTCGCFLLSRRVLETIQLQQKQTAQ